MPVPVLPPIGSDLRQWGRQITQYLRSNLAKIAYKTDDDKPSDDGVILFDEPNKYPVVSVDGEFKQVVLEGGHATFIRTTDVTAAAANTAYSITYDAPSSNYKIDRDDTNNERIVFEDAGEYLINFTAQIASTSSSDVTFSFWPAKNGTNIEGSTMKNVLHSNGATLVVSRTAIFEFDADDYLEVKWAVDSTNGFLDYQAASSPVPAAPATTLAITRIHG